MPDDACYDLGAMHHAGLFHCEATCSRTHDGPPKAISFSSTHRPNACEQISNKVCKIEDVTQGEGVNGKLSSAANARCGAEPRLLRFGGIYAGF